jgi:hypothetical protein
MGRSGSSSQANQSTNTSSTDGRIVNESGVVARDSVLDLSSYFSANTSNTNNTTDNSSMVLTSVDSSNKTTNTNTVSGSYNTTADPLIAKAAFDFATNNDAMYSKGLDSMMGFAKELTNKTQDSATSLAARFQDGVAQAFDSGRNTTPGGIDNKTMIILGVVGAAAVAFAMKKGN